MLGVCDAPFGKFISKTWMTFQKANAKESLKDKLAFQAIKFVVKMLFKDEKEAAKQKVTLFVQVLFAESKSAL